MNTIATNKYLKPLEIAIGILCIICAVWTTIIISLNIYSSDSYFILMKLDSALGIVFRTIVTIIKYLSYLLSPLLLLWFISMRKQLRIVTTVLAIIGLSMAITLSISNGIINALHPLTDYSNIPETRVLWNIVSGVIHQIINLLIALAFFTMHNQFNKKIGAWATAIGVLYLGSIFIQLLYLLNSYVFIRLYSFENRLRAIQTINTLSNTIILFREVATAVFFLSLALTRRERSVVDSETVKTT